jgi:hypothetical protein
MPYPSDRHRDSPPGSMIERDQQIINGSILALTAFAIVVGGIAWYAVAGNRTISINTPALERQDSTSGYGMQHRERMPERAHNVPPSASK